VSDIPLSIVIPCHNRADLLQTCLDTVTGYMPRGTEVIVVDDGSPDASASRTAERFPLVKVLRLKRRRGFCVAVNAGIAASRGAVVELLNDDTEVAAGWAEAALRWFEDARVGAVAPLVLAWPDGQLIDSAGDRYYLGGVAGKRGHRRPLTSEYLTARPVFGASASSGFYRRTALLEVGAFAESFGAYFEDVDLAFRLQRAGYQTIFEPASRVLHRISASHGVSSRRLLEQQSRNEERVFWRNMPSRVLLGALPRHLAVLAGKAWKRWREGTLLPFVMGRIRVLGEVGDLLRHRRRLEELSENRNADWQVETTFWE
jgi:GT2 family glycosyltransferase